MACVVYFASSFARSCCVFAFLRCCVRGADEKMQQLIAEAQTVTGEAAAADDTGDVQDVHCLCLHQPLLLRGSQVGK